MQTLPPTHDRINFVKNQIDLYPDLSLALTPRKEIATTTTNIAKLIGFLTKPEETFRKYQDQTRLLRTICSSYGFL